MKMIENREVKDDRYRVFVQLEQWFSDERGRCVVSVSGARRTEWLARRLRRLLRLEGRFCLLTDGHLMPPDELLAHVLQPDECVQVVPTKHDWFDEFPEEEGEKQCHNHSDEETTINTTSMEPMASNVDECDGKNKSPNNKVLKRKSNYKSLTDIKRKALEELDKLYSNQANEINNKQNDISVDLEEYCCKQSLNQENAIINSIKQNDVSVDLMEEYSKRPRRRRVRRRRTPRLGSDTDPTPVPITTTDPTPVPITTTDPTLVPNTTTDSTSAPITTTTTVTQCSPPYSPPSPTSPTTNDNDCTPIVAPFNELTGKCLEKSQDACEPNIFTGVSSMLSTSSVQTPVVRNMNERRAPRVVHSIVMSSRTKEII